MRAIVQRLIAWYASAARDLPWRRTTDPYAIWVSEIMLQQTQVKTVIPYWERWMRELPTLRDLAKIDESSLHKLWEGLGYYTRVRNMQAAARLILEQHGGRFPSNHAEVLRLPGIGPYTAGAICSIAFNQPEPILDGNVIRVLSRLFALAGDPTRRLVRDQLWSRAAQLIEEAGMSKSAPRQCAQLNQALMELGALVCLPREPRCSQCPLKTHCAAFLTNRADAFPQPRRRPRATARRFVAFVLRRRNRYLARQRPSGGVNAHLWEFPNVETAEPDPRNAACLAGVRPGRFAHLATIRHSITRYRITLEAYFGVHQDPVPGETGWLTLAELRRLPFASAHKKILSHLANAPPGSELGDWPAAKSRRQPAEISDRPRRRLRGTRAPSVPSRGPEPAPPKAHVPPHSAGHPR